MNTIANILTAALVSLLLINGVRLTFFPNSTCNLARNNEVMSVSDSVLEFHKMNAEKAQ